MFLTFRFHFLKEFHFCRCEFSKVIQSQTFFSIFSSVQPTILYTYTSISDVILWQGVHGEGRGGGENVTKMSNNNNEPPDCGRHTELLSRAAQESRGGAAHSVTPAALTFNLAFEPLTFFTYLVTYQHGSPTVAAKAIFGSSGNTVISVVLSTQVGQRLRPNWDFL